MGGTENMMSLTRLSMMCSGVVGPGSVDSDSDAQRLVSGAPESYVKSM